MVRLIKSELEGMQVRSSICTQSTWISLRLSHSRLDNCANGILREVSFKEWTCTSQCGV